MKWEEKHIHLNKLAALFMLISILGAMPIAISDPLDSPNLDGTRLLTWNFDTQLDYVTDNITLETGYANISTYQSIWHQTSNADFWNGTSANNINVSAGEIRLALDTGLQLLANGNFTNPMGAAGTADNWEVETTLKPGPPFQGIETRRTTGGIDDDEYCWRNLFVDGNAGLGYNHSVWLNQTFILTTIPLDVNISVFHNFVNNSFDITPGTLAEIYITNLNTNQTYNINSTGWVNETYLDYTPLRSEDITPFNETGLYNISLYTNTSSADNVSHQPTNIENFWDNASIEYSAYRPSGNFTSQVLDTGSYAMWNNISWRESLPTGTDIELYVRTGNSSVPTDSIWSDWSGALTDPASSVIDRPWGQYIQYRVELITGSTNLTPILENVTVKYNKFNLAGEIQTLDYSPTNITSWGFFSHDEELNGQTVRYQYSTNSGTLWTDMPLDGDLRYLNPGASIRIKALLSTTDSVVTPSVITMELSYVSSEPAITLEPVWNVESAESGDTVRLYVHFNNSVDSISSTAWLNVYLDENLEYRANNTDSLTSFQEFIPDDDTNVQKYVFTNIPLGDNTIWIDSVLNTGMDEGTILQTTVTLEYLDPLENRVESKLELTYLRVDAPVISAELIALENSTDVGDTINYQVQVNNTGHGLATMVWLNTTLDDRLQIPLLNTQNFTRRITNLVGLSSQLIYFNLTLRENVVQNSVIPIQLTIQYSDASGFMRQTESNQATILTALKSSVSLALLTQESQVNSDELFVITVQYSNTGYGSAESIYFNMTLPDGLELDSSSEDFISFGNQYVWEIDDVGQGTHSFTITFRALKMSQDYYTSEIIMNMQVTDPVEGELDLASSNVLSIEIERIYTFWEEIYWPWSGIAMALAGFFIIYGLWYYFKPEPPTIDDAFVIYRDGRLISHRKSSSGLKEELDGDLVSAMLTVVQEFISESLSKDKTDKVKKLEFGDRELYVERGENIHISVMYSGSMNKKLENQIFELRHMIEEEHPFLSTWDGRMTKLEDINPQLDKLIEEWQFFNGKGDYSPGTNA